MISIRGILLTAAIIIFMLFFPATTAFGTETPLQVEVQVNGTLNLRFGPATSYPVLTRLPAGTVLDLLSHEEEWLLVRCEGGNTGWVADRYTSLTPSLRDKLSSAPAIKVVVQTHFLNVRSGPGTEYSCLNQVRLQETLPVYEHNSGWLLVRLKDGSTGWVNDSYVSSPVEAEVMPDDAAASNHDISENNNEPVVKSSDETAAADEEPKELDNESLPLRVTVNVSSLRMRKGPGLQHEIIVSIPKNTVLLVQDEQDQWLKAGLPDGREGWVAGWHTQPLNSEDVANEPAVQLPRLATVNTGVLRVRSGPGLDYSQVDRVFSGNYLLVLDEEKGWNYVQLPNNNYGWVSSDYTVCSSMDNNMKDNITIAIDPGHGGRDRGATGVNGLLEKDVVLTVSMEAANQLRDRGFEVIMTRSSDVEISLEERVEIAERAEADLFISIHANAHPNPAISGTEVFYVPHKPTSTQSFYIASLLQKEVSKALQLPSLGTKTAKFFVIRETTMPAALLELAFLSNAVDEAILQTPQAQQQAADAIVRAILSYYNN